MKLTPHGIVHMGLSSASPTALQDWLPRSDRSRPSPRPQDPQDAARAPDSAQAAHLPGSPPRSPGSPSSRGSSPGFPRDPLSRSLNASPSSGAKQPSISPSLPVEFESAGTGDGRVTDGTQTGVDSSRSLQTEAPEDQELLSLRPTRDFVEHFNQHTSFHRRKIMRNSRGETAPDAGSQPSPPACTSLVRLLDTSFAADEHIPLCFSPASSGLPGDENSDGSASQHAYPAVPGLSPYMLERNRACSTLTARAISLLTVSVLWGQAVARAPPGRKPGRCRGKGEDPEYKVITTCSLLPTCMSHAL